MMEASGGTRLVAKAVHEVDGEVGIEQVLADGLDRDGALAVGIAGFVDDAHRARAEDAFDLARAQTGGLDHFAHCCASPAALISPRRIGFAPRPPCTGAATSTSDVSASLVPRGGGPLRIALV